MVDVACAKCATTVRGLGQSQSDVTDRVGPCITGLVCPTSS
jgi:hypothetical protein